MYNDGRNPPQIGAALALVAIATFILVAILREDIDPLLFFATCGGVLLAWSAQSTFNRRYAGIGASLFDLAGILAGIALLATTIIVYMT